MKQQAPSHASSRPESAEQPTTSAQTQPALPASVDSRFRINERTRRIGLAGVAHARAVLAEQAARREAREAERASCRTAPNRQSQQRAA
ncbi:unannotated protein [freshwater metagenome]|uniref:Unannotated protein n=1 Tax=freshwater metagenome TaxID=449393 RepID=A0A6J6UVX9_9ZZZZ